MQINKTVNETVMYEGILSMIEDLYNDGYNEEEAENYLSDVFSRIVGEEVTRIYAYK